MLKTSLFGRKKTTRPFKHYYSEWVETLRTTHLPPLRHQMSTITASPNLLSTQVEILHHHFQSYYQTLDIASSNDVAQILFPNWRNSLEKPFLWLGDLHPYLFTNLLRSFLQNEDEDEEEEDHQDNENQSESEIGVGESSEFLNKPWPVQMAWKNPSKKNLMTRIDQIECGLRLMVPALADRARKAQAGFIERVGSEWGNWEGKSKEEAREAVGNAVEAEMEEMVGVFVDANRLRSSVLTEIMSITSVYQAALFLEGLAQFFVGFRGKKLLAEFKRCKMSIN